MTEIKKSFLREIIGSDTYDKMKDFAKVYAPVYAVITGILFLITRVCYWRFLCTLFSLLTGWSLFSLLFIASLMLLCNIECNGEESEYRRINIFSRSYKLTIVWFIVLLALGIAFGILSDREKSHYQFQCTTYHVDHVNEIYHIIENDDCENIGNRYDLVEMKGHEIEEQTDYQLCPHCEEWHEDVMSTLDSERHIRR